MEENDWVPSDSMSSARYYAAAAQLKDGRLLVTGGINNSQLNSAEMLTEEGWESTVPSLPVTIAYHCLVNVNSTTVMAIGGYRNGQSSKETFYFTFGEESWTEGPKLMIGRNYHSCGRIRRDKDSQEMSIIVVGGFDGSYISSTEILNESSNEWHTGPELPFGICLSEIVEYQNEGVVLIGGEGNSNGLLDALFQLPHGGQDASWTEMEQKMKTERYFHSAFLVPDNIADCS